MGSRKEIVMGEEKVEKKEEVKPIKLKEVSKESKESPEKSKITDSSITILRTIPIIDEKKALDLPEESREKIDIHKFITTPAMVEVTYGRKIMLKQYEPAEVRVSVTMPCYKEEVQECYDLVGKIVGDIMEREMGMLVAARDEIRKGGKGVEPTKTAGGGSEKSLY